MTDEELAELVAVLRRFRTDAATVEAKRCGTATLPKSLRETLSAFANTAGGGIIILGLDEKDRFAASGVPDAAKLAADLGSLARDAMDPPLSPMIDFHRFEGVDLVTPEVPELLPSQKPCYYRAAGMVNGSYKRVGDGDYHLTPYEVQLLISSRGQPREDEESVAGAGPADLDEDLVGAYLENLRHTRPDAFAGLDARRMMLATRVLVKSEGAVAPSLAGLITFGKYPQEFFPQLNATFVSYPTDDGQPLASGERFLDNVTIDGNIPTMLRHALSAVRRNMQRRGVVTSGGRADVWDYPDAALREVLVNALVHRDLSSDARGTAIQIEMYPNRLLVRNPGGLFGPVRIDQLGEEGISSSRNATLLKILEDVPVPPATRTVCENRGSGIRVMIGALRAAGMSLPNFRDQVATFSVEFPKHSLFGDETISWIKALNQSGLSDSQHTALALLRQNGPLDNPTYRASVGIDSRQATAELQDLVARELVVQSGKGRWARYILSGQVVALGDAGDASVRLRPADRRSMVLKALGDETLSRREIEVRTGLGSQVVSRWLRTLRREGRVDRTSGPSQSKNIRYWATEPSFILGQSTLPGLEQ